MKGETNRSWQAGLCSFGLLSALMIFAGTEVAQAQWVCPRPNPDPGCPDLATPYGALPDAISVPTRWGGLNEAPSLADPTLVCEGAGQDFFVLWRRHERASDCVWIDQGNITLRSGAIFEMQDFPMMNDPNNSFGVPGEVAIIEECDDVFSPASDEVTDLWLDFDQQWQDLGSTIGIMAVHAKRLVDEDGDSCARGIVAEIGDPSMPWLMVSDPQDLCDQSGGDCQFNERSLAHEFGHLCSLTHVTTADRLMVTGGDTDDTALTEDELDQCRDYLTDNSATLGLDALGGADVAFDAPVNQGEQDVAFDGAADPQVPRAIDMRKVLVQRSSDGGLRIHTLSRGLMVPDNPADYLVAIDIDNNAETGVGLSQLLDFKEITIGGVEWVGLVTVQRPPEQCTEFQLPIILASALSADRFDTAVTTGRRAFPQAERLIEIKHPQVRAIYRTTCMLICDFDVKTGIHTHVAVPTLQRLTIELPGELVESRGPMRIQIVARDHKTNLVDALPNNPAVMTFPRVEFPTMRMNPPAVRAGDPVQVNVAGLRPGSSLHTLLGVNEINTGEVIVDNAGRASFVMPVPPTMAVGPHLVTIGADVLTADDILQILAPGGPLIPPRPKEVLELLQSFEDLLRRQAIHLEQFGELIEDFQRRELSGQ